jgi:hypothetical protein
MTGEQRMVLKVAIDRAARERIAKSKGRGPRGPYKLRNPGAPRVKDTPELRKVRSKNARAQARVGGRFARAA